jgi:hypothetical protein
MGNQRDHLESDAQDQVFRVWRSFDVSAEYYFDVILQSHRMMMGGIRTSDLQLVKKTTTGRV